MVPIVPVGWPVVVVLKTINLTKANTPAKLMDANSNRAYFALSNDQVEFTLSGGGTPVYTLFDPLLFSLDQPIQGGTRGYLGAYLAPGVFEPSLFGSTSQQEVWVWSPLTNGARTIVGFEGVYDPTFDPESAT